MAVLVDSREKFPLLFPASVLWYPTRAARPHYLINIVPETKRMSEGDYAMKGYEDVCLIERKGSLSELSSNLCSKDYKRAHSAFVRLTKACTHPYLLLEETPAGILPTTYKHDRPTPDRVVDAFFREVSELKIPLIFAGRARSPGHRRRLGHMVLKIMIGHVMKKNQNYS